MIKWKQILKVFYACGDCTGGILQVSTAVSKGTVAALSVIQYLKTQS